MNIEGKLGDLLGLIGSDEVLTPTIITHLRTMAKRDLSELASMSGLKLAGEIRTVTESAVEQPLAVANRLRQIITETFGGNDEDVMRPATPIQVEVRQEKTLAQYNLGELLAALATNPTRYAEITPFLEREPQYAAALRKSVNLGIPTTDGKLDPAETTTHITMLARQYAKVQRIVNGRRPAPIEKLLGLEVRALIHPFTFEPVQGPDENGFDWGALSDQLHKALLWAHSTHNPAWPTTIDHYQHGTEIFTDPLPARWQRILEDYEAACIADETNVVASRYHNAESLALIVTVRSGFAVRTAAPAATPVDNEAHYKRLLEQAADGTLEVRGTGASSSGGVYDFIDAAGTGVSVHGVVVLKGGAISGTGSSGIIYRPKGVSIRISGTGSSVRTVGKTYEELALLAGIR